MIKMFTTQLSGLFNRIADKEEFSIEDGARLLAQASVGEGSIFIKGFAEMESVTLEAVYGREPLQGAKALAAVDDISEADRVLLISRFSIDEEAVSLAKQLVEKGIPFAAVSGVVSSEGDSLAELADIHIDTKLIKGMLPGEELGERVGFPSSMAALYVYFLIKFSLDEMLEEY
ncbi:DUF2529 domain-containing protein [Rossellomorea aquimaris]|uniref:DUF2529 domain-containing protein n=1 Tax=Rossellomorea aquimaris TaxID=189382 RepID=A0A5D4TRN8_9BACI|nr:DUF2529 domain-containing protein [Rossellomorea aquimaris]TYS78387.1 DUF2529 domain-containing protein [Rossellomorea aquimaris]